VYRFTVRHSGLGKVRVVSGPTEGIARERVLEVSKTWDALYKKQLERERLQAAKLSYKVSVESKIAQANELTDEAEKAFETLRTLLTTDLAKEHQIDFEGSKPDSNYEEEPPTCRVLLPPPPAPDPSASTYQPTLGLLDKLISSWAKQKAAECAARLAAARGKWEAEVKKTTETNALIKARYLEAITKYEKAKENFDAEIARQNAAIDSLRDRYNSSEAAAIKEYCDAVLSNSVYPEFFPNTWELQYIQSTKTLIVEYRLPDVARFPTVKEVKYIKAKDEFKESYLKADLLNSLYDSAIYQTCLRVLHELFSADSVKAIEAIAFNGLVEAIDKATGQMATACIISIHVVRDEFERINLGQVDPKSCFKSLKGIGSSQLHVVTPIAPILALNREDHRFIQAHEVADSLNDSVNLAAMDWEDFEHLIREIFEAEFKSTGGEVKVTQASRDGGVDAIAFDPDPIRGGKIVIQAKRYTNTVGVSAVRDLYGTVMNEGATKGILVTTADYGSDAYSFIKDKPLTLMNGANLLYLLEKHGRRAKIDLKEARVELGGKEANRHLP